MLEDLLRICAPGTRLCIAADITLPEETIRTRTVAQWRKEPMTIGKRPCVFMILA
jgi:16S rRNA (cytidine1402-2'-O)-methyltransferase